MGNKERVILIGDFVTLNPTAGWSKAQCRKRYVVDEYNAGNTLTASDGSGSCMTLGEENWKLSPLTADDIKAIIKQHHYNQEFDLEKGYKDIYNRMVRIAAQETKIHSAFPDTDAKIMLELLIP